MGGLCWLQSEAQRPRCPRHLLSELSRWPGSCWCPEPLREVTDFIRPSRLAPSPASLGLLSTHGGRESWRPPCFLCFPVPRGGMNTVPKPKGSTKGQVPHQGGELENSTVHGPSTRPATAEAWVWSLCSQVRRPATPCPVPAVAAAGTPSVLGAHEAHPDQPGPSGSGRSAAPAPRERHPVLGSGRQQLPVQQRPGPAALATAPMTPQCWVCTIRPWLCAFARVYEHVLVPRRPPLG